MRKQNEVEDSLEFCKDIEIYEKHERARKFNMERYPRLKDYIDGGERFVKKDNKTYEEPLHTSESIMEELENKELETNKQQTKGWIRSLVQVMVSIIVAFLLVYTVTTYVVTVTSVHGESMKQTLEDGDVVLIDKISYRFHPPSQFDPIVFTHNSQVNLVKRIIALPGQTIQITNGTIFVNGEVVNENFGTEEIEDAGEAELPITLGDDEYFVLGDNRNNSTDSRSTYVGVVRRQDIIGKVVFRLYPVSQIQTIK